MKVRNIAIIAHVDHGKTTLVDALLKCSHTFRENQVVDTCVMDNNAIERERGITILAKNTAIKYEGYKINILDTPGHADFGGEVERIMGMVDGVVLVVDAYEGTMPQTRFVLKKALEAGHKPIVVVNKIDKPSARPFQVVDEVLDLLIELGADESQLEFPVIYTSAVNMTSSESPDVADQQPGMEPLFKKIIEYVPEPIDNSNESLQFQPAILDYNDFVGRIGIGKIARGTMRANQMVSCMRRDGSIIQFRLQKLFTFLGLDKIETEEAHAGDIVAISGLSDIYIGETICEVGKEEALPQIIVSEPTLQMTFGTNTSPFCGKDGKSVTASKIDDRLMREIQKDVSLRVQRLGTSEEWVVSGRGELHLSVLIETMRREGFEFQVSRPKAILKEIDGVTYEPYEEVTVECPGDTVGSVITLLGDRGGVMKDMKNTETQSKVVFDVPARGLIGFNTEFMSATKGYGILSHSFNEYRPMEKINVGKRSLGALVSIAKGPATAYSLGHIEDRGTMFIEPGEEVYEGMIVGQSNRDLDMAVNVVTAKQQTNTRSSNKDTTVVLKRPLQLSLEQCLEYINDDELVEVTPNHIRLRKRILDTVSRKKWDARQREAEENA
ncbi:MAG: translational GTPase TypA [Acholeplasmatales bacterium]|nr:translational GTPase TypA [Acholeplasmatales bacterium]